MWSDDAGDVFGTDELSNEDLERAYAEAVCRGADLTGFSAHDERINGALALLAAITARTPTLRLLMTVVDEDAGAARDLALDARRQSAGVVRLAHRALKVHPRDVGYEPAVWQQEALTNASACLATWRRRADEHEASPGVLEPDRASWALAAAIAAVPGDRMAVPGYLGTAQGAWLSAYLRARHCVNA